MKALVILNPDSGQHSGEPVKEAVSRHFDRSRIKYETHETTKEEKTDEYVRSRLKDGFDVVVAAGGDGTVSAVVSGLVGSRTALAIIPAGTENMLARDLNVPLEIDKAAGLIAGSHVIKQIDAMRVGKKAYVLNVSIGISPTIVGSTTPKEKRRLGPLAYVWTGISKIFAIRQHYLEIAIDGKVQSTRAIEVLISNSGYFANKLYPKGPDIRIDNGHLHVWIVNFKTLRDYPWYWYKVITRKPSKHLSNSASAYKSVSVKSQDPMPIQGDGDIIGTTPFEIDVLAGALAVVVPEKSPEEEKKAAKKDKPAT